MEILGRTVEVVQYKPMPLITAYVNQLPTDCRRNSEPNYQCIGNCDGKLVVARFQERTPISIKALVPVELSLHPAIQELKGIKDLAGLETIAQQPRYELRNEKKGKSLYFDGQLVAAYNPCGMDINLILFSQEIQEIIRQLKIRVDELYKIAKTIPFENVVEDPAIARQLSNPLLEHMMSVLGGQEGTRLVQKLRNAQAKNN